MQQDHDTDKPVPDKTPEQTEPETAEPGQQPNDTGDHPDQQQAREPDWKAMYEQAQEKYLRAVAELQNYRRRTNAEMLQRQQYANEDLLEQLLPVADNCNQALAGICETDDPETIVKGVEMILAQLHDFMQRHGVERINPHGDQFDPQVHEAVEAVPTDDAEPNTIIEVIQPGYTLGDRLLRPATVRVAVGPK